MVINKTRALDIKTHAVSPEFIINISFKKFSFNFDYGKINANMYNVLIILIIL
jgi:hypothetical protein